MIFLYQGREKYNGYYGKEVVYMNGKTLKILGAVVAIAGAGISILSGIISDKQLDLKVTEKVALALAEKSE